MKKTLYSGILAAAVFAVAADTRAQSNVYSLNVVSYINLNINSGAFTRVSPVWLNGPGSSRYGLQESGTSTSRSLELVCERSTPSMIEYRSTSLAMLSFHPVRVWVSPWLAALISLPVLSVFLSLVFIRRRRNAGSS